jgi:hypothetical protein
VQPHLAPTRAVVESFGAISRDNRRILIMEWIAEGLTHISLGVLVALSGAAALLIVASFE